MIEIFLEAPMELKILILGGIAALIVVLVKGNGSGMILTVDLNKIKSGVRNKFRLLGHEP